jgi:hypothetical protein
MQFRDVMPSADFTKVGQHVNKSKQNICTPEAHYYYGFPTLNVIGKMLQLKKILLNNANIENDPNYPL